MIYHSAPDTMFMATASVSEEARGNGQDPLEGLPRTHIYLQDKVDWYNLPDDGLPRHDTMPNEAKYLVHRD